VGKTQLAVEYAYRHASDYALVWWLRAEEPATLAGDYARLADPLDLPLKAEKDQSLIVLAVRRWLETNRGWLLVFDNVEKPDDLREYLPQTAQGHIVVTSRNPGWRNIGKTLSVEVLPREQATQLLLRRSGSRDAAAADTLAEELGDLPLALEQAAAYADETACSLTRYLELFRTHREVVLKRRGVTQDYPASVAATWEISFRHLEQESPAAAELLNLCAFLAPEAMPLDLIAEGRQHLPEALKAALGGPVATDELKAALRRYSLASVQGDDITLHRLVQAVARDRMDEKRQQGWAASAVQLMRTLFPEDDEDVRNWPTESRLLPHMSAAADHAASRGVASEDAVATMSRVGAHLNVRAQFTEAEALLTRATALGERALGPQHAGYARALCNLAQYYDGQGRYQEGEPLASRAVEVYSRVLTSDHPDLATALNVLARFRKAQGRSTEVEDLHLRSLAIRERRFGKKSPEVAEALHNLGTQYYIVGRFAEAEGLLRRALSLREELLGPDHPVTAGSMTNLALLYSDVGKATDARYWIERAHRIVECTFDSRHPRVAVSLHNRACVCHSQGENVEALMYFWRSIRIWKNVYGPDRPTIALSLNGLALVCRFQGRFARAESLCRRAVAIWVKAVGPDGPHQYLAEVLQNLGAIHVAQRRFAEAEVELGRALEMQERILLSNHPDVADTLGIMGQLYDKTGRHSEAKAMRERAVRIREKQQEKG
jgi:tetratricopeptide (TPR) repeat protein